MFIITQILPCVRKLSGRCLSTQDIREGNLGPRHWRTVYLVQTPYDNQRRRYGILYPSRVKDKESGEWEPWIPGPHSFGVDGIPLLQHLSLHDSPGETVGTLTPQHLHLRKGWGWIGPPRNKRRIILRILYLNFW